MDKQIAVARLRDLIGLSSGLSRGSEAFTKWRRDCEIAIEHIFGADTRHLTDLRAIKYSPGAWNMANPEPEWDRAFSHGLGRARAVLSSMIDEIESFWPEGTTSPDTGPGGPFVRLERIGNRFHLVARQLRERREGRATLDVTDEYDLQDLWHALLRLDFDDIRPEEWTPSYAGGASRMDFLLKEHGVVLELKKTRRTMSPRDVGDQLIIDIARYKRHPDCRALLCFVYDPDGLIGNPAGLESDLSRAHDGLDVRVLVGPRGA